MALSELAPQRRNRVELWVKDQLNSEFYAILARYQGNNRGAIAYKPKKLGVYNAVIRIGTTTQK